MRLSYSQLEWFLRCPYLYKYQFIDKHMLPKGKEALFGGLLHKVLEELYRRKPAIPTLTELLGFYEKQWQARSLDGYFPNTTEARIYFTEGMRMVKDVYTSEDIAASRVLALEQFFEAPVEDSERGVRHVLTGRIDRIDKTKEGIEVIDYKTGRTLKSQKAIANDLQLSLYCLGVASLWPDLVKKYKNAIRATLYFLRHNEKVSVQKRPEELEEIKNTLVSYIRDIEEAVAHDSFEARPSALCAKEPYARICPFFKDRYQEEKPLVRGKIEVGKLIREYIALSEESKRARRRLGELNPLIHEYLDERGIEGVYDGSQGILRSRFPLYQIDTALLKRILTNIGKWEEVNEVSVSKLKKLIPDLSLEHQRAIKKAFIVKGQQKILRIKSAPVGARE